MAQICVNVEKVIEEGKPISVSEPCCGSGGMVLALAKQFAPKKAVDLIRAVCADVNVIACDMTYINTTLWGIPSQIRWEDTIKMEIYGAWNNIHWARVGEEQRQSTLKMLDIMREMEKPTPEPEIKITLPDKQERKNMVQMDLFDSLQ